jgi:AcrR family transcriptional regulator
MARRAYHHGDLSATLIALATAHIAREGVDTLSVRALAKEAGVAHRAAYQHFPDKDGLIAAVMTNAYDALAARCAASRADAKTVEARLQAAARAYADFAAEAPQLFLAMTGPRVNQSGAHKELEAAVARAWRYIAGPIGEGVDAGLFTIADKRAAAAIFWGGLVGVLSQAALGRLKLKAAERAAFIEVVASRLIAGLKA